MITKGTRVTATWFLAAPIGTYSLAGCQNKAAATAATAVTITGVCRHFRGDHPTAPSVVKVYVEPDELPPGVATTRPYGCNCDDHGELVEVDQSWITGVGQ